MKIKESEKQKLLELLEKIKAPPKIRNKKMRWPYSRNKENYVN